MRKIVQKKNIIKHICDGAGQQNKAHQISGEVILFCLVTGKATRPLIRLPLKCAISDIQAVFLGRGSLAQASRQSQLLAYPSVLLEATGRTRGGRVIPFLRPSSFRAKHL